MCRQYWWLPVVTGGYRWSGTFAWLNFDRTARQGCQFGLFSAKFVEFGIFENRLAGRKMASRSNCFWPILAFLKFVVITVKFTCTIKLICFVCKEMVVHKFVKKVTSEFCMLIVLIDRGELG